MPRRDEPDALGLLPGQRAHAGCEAGTREEVVAAHRRAVGQLTVELIEQQLLGVVERRIGPLAAAGSDHRAVGGERDRVDLATLATPAGPTYAAPPCSHYGCIPLILIDVRA